MNEPDTRPQAIAGLQLDHVGIQVRDLAAAVALFSRVFGYAQVTAPVVNTRQQVEVVFLEKAGSLQLKLFRSLAPDAKPGPPKLHHLAFVTADLDGSIAAMVQEGGRVLSAPAPGEAFDDGLIAFLFAAGLNIELVTTDKRRARLSG